MKRQTTDWPKIFANHVSNKGLVSRICKEISKITDASSQLENRDIGVKTEFIENIFASLLRAWFSEFLKTISKCKLYIFEKNSQALMTLTTKVFLESLPQPF